MRFTLDIDFKNPFSQYIQHRKERAMFGKLLHNGIKVVGMNGKDYIKGGYVSSLPVYAVINKILNAAKKAQFVLEEQTAEGWERVNSHELLDLLANPNPTQGTPEFIEAVMGYRYITGESMIYRNRQGEDAGRDLELWPFAPTIVEVKFNEWGIPQAYEIKQGAMNASFSAEQVVYVRSFNPLPHDGRGMSPMEAGKYAITKNKDSYEAAMRLLQNGGPLGVMTTDEPTGSEQVNKIAGAWEDTYKGPDAYGEIAFIGQKLHWTQLGLNAVDLAVMESQKMDLRDICNLYQVPIVLMNDSEASTYNNIVEARKDLISNVVISDLNHMVGELNRTIVKDYRKERNGNKLRLSVDPKSWPEMQEDESAKAQMLNTAYWFTPNEKRVAMGKAPIENSLMDEVYLPSNLLPVAFGTDEQMKRMIEAHSEK